MQDGPQRFCISCALVITNNPLHWPSNTIGYYITHTDIAIAANTPAQL